VFANDDGTGYYVCRVNHEKDPEETDLWVPGYVDIDDKCYYSYGNEGWSSGNYEILSVK
jgi:hypothetical protein